MPCILCVCDLCAYVYLVVSDYVNQYLLLAIYCQCESFHISLSTQVVRPISQTLLQLDLFEKVCDPEHNKLCFMKIVQLAMKFWPLDEEHLLFVQL